MVRVLGSVGLTVVVIAIVRIVIPSKAPIVKTATIKTSTLKTSARETSAVGLGSSNADRSVSGAVYSIDANPGRGMPSNGGPPGQSVMNGPVSRRGSLMVAARGGFLTS
jgi:hypothetical protein